MSIQIGKISQEKPSNDDIKEICNFMKKVIESKMELSFEEFEPINFASQVI